MNERYLVSKGGRVKAAGVTYNLFEKAAAPFLSQPNSTKAQELIQNFNQLRNSPPDLVRDRFFPRSEATKGIIKSGAGLSRVALATDQGAGQFLTHIVDNDGKLNNLRYEIDRQSGYCVLEAHLQNQLDQHNYPAPLMKQLAEVKKLFALGDVKSTQLAYELFTLLANEYGIQVQRRAQVGREGVFFIHPSMPKGPIIVPKDVHQQILERGNMFGVELAQIALNERARFAMENGIMARNTKRTFLPLYFQSDFLLASDGRIQVADIHLPDVGFFLLSLDPEGNQTVADAQNTVAELIDDVSSLIRKKALIHGAKDVYFITRESVINNCEDTLEIREIETIRKSLEKLGVKTNLISLEQVIDLTPDHLAILMNVDPQDIAFKKLLFKRVNDESVPMYPDPFLVLARDKLTEHRQTQITRAQLSDLKENFATVEKSGAFGRHYVLIEAINGMFERMGLPSDCNIFHMYVAGQQTPVPFYRYDPRGIQIALNYAEKVDSVVIRAIPINKNNSVLFENGSEPVYSVFRYMFYELKV